MSTGLRAEDELVDAAMAGLPEANEPGSASEKRVGGLWAAFDHCRVESGAFAFAGAEDRVSRLHRLALQEAPGFPGPLGRAGRALAYGTHLVMGFRQAVTYWRKHGAFVARRHGVSHGRQLRDLVHCVARNNQFARHYYWRGLYLDPSRRSWLAQIEHRQLTVLLGALARRLPLAPLANKFLWARHGRRHGLPVVTSLAAWNGRGEELIPGSPLPRADLFVKPLADYGGNGSARLDWDGTAGRHVCDRQKLDGPALREWLSRRALGRGCLVQARLRNSPEWAALWGDRELASLRIVTGRAPGGGPLVLAAGLRVPSRFTRVGHLERRVLLASVSTKDGSIGACYLQNVSKRGYSRHPDTDELLEGRALPGWERLEKLALAAHATLPWVPFVGWDLAETEEGPVLLEANVFWGAGVVQLPGSPPLGETAFPEIYLAWWRRLETCAGGEQLIQDASR